MASESKPTTPVTGTDKVTQVALVVRDIEEKTRTWSRFLGREPAFSVNMEPGASSIASYRGAEQECRARLVFFRMENLMIELIEPIGEDNCWAEHLREKGEGIHHIAFDVVDTAGIEARAADQGISVIQQGGDPATGQYTYLDAGNPLGLVIELLEGY